MVYFSNINTALASAHLSWTYNWWHDYNSVRASSQYLKASSTSCEANSLSLRSLQSLPSYE